MKVRTRFAPSPTGRVHIGNMRTALFNWLFARHHGGKFLLRIEDTDRERSTPEAIQALLNIMDWIQLDVDEEPLYQSERIKAHLETAEKLLSEGRAYRQDKNATGQGMCVLFKMPDTKMVFKDLIRGTLSKPPGEIPDFVIVRSDGSPVFHLANVLDDIKQDVTHVIRGDDHIENTYRHITLYQALGAEIPYFAHLPLLVNAQGRPYSKRDGDAFVDNFREKGFLIDALFNYLALLGWSPGDDREIMTRDELIEAFTLDRCQSSPAQINLKKLLWMNGEYMAKLPKNRFENIAFQVLEKDGICAESEYARQVFGLVHKRVKTVADIAPATGFFFSDDFEYDAKAVRKKLRKEGVPDILESVQKRFRLLTVLNEASAAKTLHDAAEELGMERSAVMISVRIAVSGVQCGPDLFPLLTLLGRARILARIDRARKMLQ